MLTKEGIRHKDTLQHIITLRAQDKIEKEEVKHEDQSNNGKSQAPPILSREVLGISLLGNTGNLKCQDRYGKQP